MRSPIALAPACESACSTTGSVRPRSEGCGRRLRDAGVEVIAFNPPSLDSPLAWLTRDHRKCIVVDGEVAFVSGLCVSAKWEGNPQKRLEPWRDTGIEIHGPAVAEVERSFEHVWSAAGGTRYRSTA